MPTLWSDISSIQYIQILIATPLAVSKRGGHLQFGRRLKDAYSNTKSNSACCFEKGRTSSVRKKIWRTYIQIRIATSLLFCAIFVVTTCDLICDCSIKQYQPNRKNRPHILNNREEYYYYYYYYRLSFRKWDDISSWKFFWRTMI